MGSHFDEIKPPAAQVAPPASEFEARMNERLGAVGELIGRNLARTATIGRTLEALVPKSVRRHSHYGSARHVTKFVLPLLAWYAMLELLRRGWYPGGGISKLGFLVMVVGLGGGIFAAYHRRRHALLLFTIGFAALPLWKHLPSANALFGDVAITQEACLAVLAGFLFARRTVVRDAGGRVDMKEQRYPVTRCAWHWPELFCPSPLRPLVRLPIAIVLSFLILPIWLHYRVYTILHAIDQGYWARPEKSDGGPGEGGGLLEGGRSHLGSTLSPSTSLDRSLGQPGLGLDRPRTDLGSGSSLTSRLDLGRHDSDLGSRPNGVGERSPDSGFGLGDPIRPSFRPTNRDAANGGSHFAPIANNNDPLKDAQLKRTPGGAHFFELPDDE